MVIELNIRDAVWRHLKLRISLVLTEAFVDNWSSHFGFKMLFQLGLSYLIINIFIVFFGADTLLVGMNVYDLV